MGPTGSSNQHVGTSWTDNFEVSIKKLVFCSIIEFGTLANGRVPLFMIINLNYNNFYYYLKTVFKFFLFRLKNRV